MEPSLPTHHPAVLGCLDRCFPDYPVTAGTALAPLPVPHGARHPGESSAQPGRTKPRINTLSERHCDRSLYPRGAGPGQRGGLGCPEGREMLRDPLGKEGVGLSLGRTPRERAKAADGLEGRGLQAAKGRALGPPEERREPEPPRKERDRAALRHEPGAP